MIVAEAGAFPLIELPSDPQGRMIEMQANFQMLEGQWDPKLKGFGADTYVLPKRVVHHLDMAVQECSEAWDMVQGGWKHHKRNPGPVDRTELVMELVDVAKFLFNAYLFMGGQPEEDMVAAAIAKNKSNIQVSRFGLDMGWAVGKRSFDGLSGSINALYSHGDGSHGEDWVKEVATAINYLRSKVFRVSDGIRHGLETLPRARRTPEGFPAAPGYIFIETVPWLYNAFQCIPGCTEQEFYSAFVAKHDIIMKRNKTGY